MHFGLQAIHYLVDIVNLLNLKNTFLYIVLLVN